MSGSAMLAPVDPWITVSAAIGLIVISGAFFSAGPLSALRAGSREKLPERLRWSRYDWPEVYRFLMRPGIPGIDPGRWSLYRSQLRWDRLFVLLYGTVLWFLIDGTLGRSLDAGNTIWRLAPLLAVLTGGVDLLEDIMLLLALGPSASDAPASQALFRGASAFTLLKWAAFLACVAAVGTGAVRLAVNGLGG